MSSSLPRRRLLQSSLLGLGSLAVPTLASHSVAEAGSQAKPARKVRYCLNTSCIREAKLSLPELIDLTAEAGYDGIEPWIREIDQYVESGGKLSDLRKRLEDRNLQVESAIGFPRWAVDDPTDRAAGFEEAKRGMELVAALGGTRIAAPPAGVNSKNATVLDLRQVAARYRELLDLGVELGVIPQVEIWGSSRNLSHLAEATFVAMAADHPKAAILPDIYHLYRGGSDFNGLRLLSGDAIQIFHVNDYPGSPERVQLNDGDRVYPGDGVAPLDDIFSALKQSGFSGVLSLELFNKDYWREDPQVVARTGLAKTKAAVERVWS